MWPWDRGAPKNFGVSYNVSATAEASNFKIGMLLGFAKAHHKIPHRKKWTWPCATGCPQSFGVSLYYFCNSRAVLLALAELLVS